MVKFLISLDIQKIRISLSAADNIEYSDEQIVEWLLAAGFSPMGKKWVVSESDLGQLDPAEVTEIEPFTDS